jgi:hypothetical protein
MKHLLLLVCPHVTMKNILSCCAHSQLQCAKSPCRVRAVTRDMKSPWVFRAVRHIVRVKHIA